MNIFNAPLTTMSRHVAAWLALWAFWFHVSRNNHPNATLNAIASALLTATFATAISVNHLRLIPRYWRSRRFGRYAVALLALALLLALACTVAIHLVYDALWGPDPARFGFWTNYGMELALVIIHLALAATGVWLMGRLTRKKPGTSSRS